MRRRIKIVADHEKATAVKEVSQAFKEWLQRKARESEESDEDLESVVSVEVSDDTDTETLQEFNKRIRKRNRIEKRSTTPGNRPIKDIVKVGSTMSGDCSNPSPYSNISAYREWKRQRTLASNQYIGRGKSVNDFMAEKRRLEEKRQKLLMNAISYDEWMDHVEDRKFLIKQILKADYEEMKKLEEDRFKDRFNKHSFDKWKEKLEQREAEEKKRKEIQRKYDVERALDKTKIAKSSNTQAYKAWLAKKSETLQKSVMAARNTQNVKHKEIETESAYENWITKKHLEDQATLEAQVKTECELLGAMKQNRTEAVA